MRSKRIRIGREDGQALPEFVFVLPLVALLLFGIAQIGIVFNNYLALTDAVRAGARTGAVSRSLGASGASTATVNKVKAAATNLNQTYFNSNCGTASQKSLCVTVTSTWVPGADLTVTGTYPYKIKIFNWPLKSGQLSSKTVERVE
jgi:Flp pilus assembly protein TadG